MTVTHATFAIERRYDCTPQQTFRAFSDPDLKRQWFANPGNWPNSVWELDFRVGGSELHSGGAPGGRQNLYRGRFHDIVESERIVFAYDPLHDDRLVSVSLATIELFADDTDEQTSSARRRFDAGEAFTLADCSAAPSLLYARVVHRWDEERLARLTHYYTKLTARPTVARVIDEAREYRKVFPLPWPDYVE
jgi:uncharacterized protein YndB with AHSA1/START domain